MKKPIALFFSPILLGVCLSSCNFNFAYNQGVQEEGQVSTLVSYSLFDGDWSQVNYLKQCERESVSALFFPSKPLVPYLSLEQYATLYIPFLKEGFRQEFVNQGSTSVWKVSGMEGDDEEEKLYFATAISYLTGQIEVGGDLSQALSLPSSVTPEALNLGLNLRAEVKNEDEAANTVRYKFNVQDFPYGKHNDRYYLPLGLYDAAFSSSSGLKMNYDYEEILLYSDYSELKAKILPEKGAAEKTATALSLAGERIKGEKMPSYLAEYNRSCFLFMMDNFYGLAKTIGISSMRTHYVNSPYYEYFISSNPAERQYAYTRAVNELDDNHTGMTEVAEIWGEKAEDSYPRNGKSYDRKVLRASLLAQRNAVYEEQEKAATDILYSQSGETAYFTLDSFQFADSVDAVLESNKKSYKPDAYLRDSAIYVGHCLETIKEEGTAKNVIIDISTNGGGVVGVLLKILALISKDNVGKLAFNRSERNLIFEQIVGYDYNLDGVADEKDCFGNDLNISILTSPYTFSAANAFAFSACYNGTAKILGVRSGGGECSIEYHALPNFQNFVHSSSLHVGYYNEENKRFLGDEMGAPVDIGLNYSDFYDIDGLEQRIENSKE